MGYRSATATDHWFNALVLFAMVAGVVLAVVNLPAGIVLITITGGLAAVVYWHARTHGYRCANCSAEFMITPWQDLTSPHTPASKFVRCPSCLQRSWAEVLLKD